MPNSNIVNELTKWPILTKLDTELITKIRMVYVFGQSGSEAFVITIDDHVYALGSNRDGCLGLGVGNYTPRATEVEPLCKKGVIKVVSNGDNNSVFVLALTEAGKVLSWGANNEGQLGNGTITGNSTPVEITLQDVITHIACGYDHSLALTNKGEVYAWGCNDHGQIGNNTASKIHLPYKLGGHFDGEKIVSIACAADSSYAVTETGKVYSWGDNQCGELALGHYKEIFTPTKIESLVEVEIVKIVGGRTHVLALSRDGSLFTWGGNEFGQLGNGSAEKSATPYKIPVSLVGRFVDIATHPSLNISVALDEREQVFMWGSCRQDDFLIPTCSPFSDIYHVLAYFASPSIMHKPLEFSKKGMSLLQCMRQGFDDAHTSDLIIKVADQVIYVHKAILQLRCTYFERMFQGDWAEKNKKLIEINNYSYGVYRLFLQYLYTDEVDTSAENAIDLHCLADEYLDTRLKKLCINIIKTKITCLNASYLYSISISEIMELGGFCSTYILNSMQAVVNSPGFKELDQSTLQRLLMKVANHTETGRNNDDVTHWPSI